LAPFQVDPQTGAIPKNREKKMRNFPWKQLSGNSYWRKGIITLFLHLWLFHLQRTLWPFQSSQSLRDNDGMSPFLLRYLEGLEIQSGRMGLIVPTLLLYWKI
jgi:hypothetical protein